ncbi:hypothetical protein Tcan_17157 [Toxocara canis]|uniref:Uncharacterized protein n=1 Tax=Toxocara canis TaxID=6265 RepID=A0A0B2W0Z9_TOXCA|nr:hypothetical protein Tcan_17157 [Toxocara canis]
MTSAILLLRPNIKVPIITSSISVADTAASLSPLKIDTTISQAAITVTVITSDFPVTVIIAVIAVGGKGVNTESVGSKAISTGASPFSVSPGEGTPVTSAVSKDSGAEAARGSRGSRSGGRRKKKKREQMPEGFEQWADEDQKYYLDVSALLRDAKATRRQCSLKREHPNRWHMFRMRSRNHPTYPIEMEAYYRSKDIFKPIDKSDQLDLEF